MEQNARMPVKEALDIMTLRFQEDCPLAPKGLLNLSHLGLCHMPGASLMH